MIPGVGSKVSVLRFASTKGQPIAKQQQQRNPPKKPSGLALAACRIRQKTDYLSIWFFLRKLGIPNRAIVKFRRKLVSINYPWISYSLPAAFALGIGDLIGQHFDRKVKKIDYIEAIKFAAIGFAIVGPILSKWNLFIYRRLINKGRQKYLGSKIVLDQLILSPLLLVLVMLTYDIQCIINKKGDIKNDVNRKYQPTFWDIIKLNIMTRPLFSLFFCYIAPLAFRRLFKVAYELYFCSYSTSAIRNGLAAPPPACPSPPPPTPVGKKGKKKGR